MSKISPKAYYRPISSLSEKERSDIRTFYLTGIPSSIDLAIIYKVSTHTIEKVCKGLAQQARTNRKNRFNWLGNHSDIYAARKQLYFYFTKKYNYGYGNHPFRGTVYSSVDESF